MADPSELQNIDTSVLETIKADQGNKLFERAQQEYPYLSDKNIAYKYSPGQGRGFLEFYDPEEIGSPEFPRPKELPLGKIGIEVFDPKTRTIDILADYVSHYGVEQDPFLMERYKQFTAIGVPVAPELANNIVTVGLGLAGIVGMATKG